MLFFNYSATGKAILFVGPAVMLLRKINKIVGAPIRKAGRLKEKVAKRRGNFQNSVVFMCRGQWK